jgi:hypothetical protein
MKGPMFGSHLSISGGMHHALLSAESYGMDTVQVFTRRQPHWTTDLPDLPQFGENGTMATSLVCSKGFSMGADAFHVFFGIRQFVKSKAELEALENRTDPRLVAARKVRLKTYFGRLTDGEPYFLLIGHHLGTFGVNNQTGAAFSESEIQAVVEETRRRLEQAHLDPSGARFYFQLEAQY